MWLVVGSFGSPTLLLLMLLRFERSISGALAYCLGLSLIAGAVACGWILHDAALAGWPVVYAAVPWAGILWGGAAVRIHDNRRLLASQQLIELRIRKLERYEAEMRVSNPEGR